MRTAKSIEETKKLIGCVCATMEAHDRGDIDVFSPEFTNMVRRTCDHGLNVMCELKALSDEELVDLSGYILEELTEPKKEIETPVKDCLVRCLKSVRDYVRSLFC